MWSKSENHTPAQGQASMSANASMAAHKGAVKAKATAALAKHAGQPGAQSPGLGAGAAPADGGGMGSPMGMNPAMSYKAHIAAAGAHAGVPLNTDDIHQTIGALTNAGAFTPQQGMALIQHNGPLQGAQGAETMRTIAKAAVNRKMRPPVPGPGGPGGAPQPAPGGPGGPGGALPPRPPMAGPPMAGPPMGGAPPMGQRPPGM